MPEAMPCSWCATPEAATIHIAVQTMPCPMPETTRPGRMSA
ncbi:Uncharacterised protein [Bordetella pertussis]|nr:Uncharacterised protein [Bordetella pertussis]